MTTVEPELIEEMFVQTARGATSVPTSTGACTLFIDPLGRPPSPVSVAGMRRRRRRR
jgi:hypothetical protein